MKDYGFFNEFLAPALNRNFKLTGVYKGYEIGKKNMRLLNFELRGS